MLFDAASIALASESGSEGKMPLTDLCNRPAGRAPVHRSIPASRTPRGALDAGGGSFDAEPPASGGAPDAPSRTKREEERRTGAALRCAGVLGRAQRSKPNPLTPPVPSEPASPDGEDRSRRAPVKERVAVSPRRLPSTCAPAPLAHRRRACRLLQPPRLSSTATDRPTTPRTKPGVAPLHGGCERPLHLSVQGRPSCLRARGHLRLTPSPAPPPRSLAGELCPDPIGSGTSCHGLAPAPAGEAERR